jgi:hypothetical protein
MKIETATEDEGNCPHCAEPVKAGDEVVRIPHIGDNGPAMLSWHYPCFFRSIVGSEMHLKRTCNNSMVCDKTCRDDPALTKREAAKRATDYWHANR